MPMDPALEPSFLTVRRSARYYAIGAPRELVRDVWIACHGYSQLARDFAVPFRSLASDTRMILVPEALNRYYIDSAPDKTQTSPVGATWMTREDREHDIRDIVSYLDILYETVLLGLAERGVGREAIQVHALGFSQGVAAVCRWAARGEATVDHIVAWGSSVPDDVNLRALGDRRPGLELDLVYGERDKYATSEAVEAQRAMLAASGLRYSVRGFDGGHALNRAVLRELMERDAG